MKKNVYNTPEIKVKPIDSEEILAKSLTIKTTDALEVDDGLQEAGSKSTSMFDTDNDQLWK